MSKVATLAHEIMRHKRLYYAGKPEIADAAFDKLEAELRQLDPEHPALHKVGADAGTGKKVRHDAPMLSLDKTYLADDVASWMDGMPVVGTVKVDGVSLSVIYEGGKLVTAKTRGDGRVGEDVTAKARWVPDLPQTLKKAPAKLEVRGELYCNETHFLKVSDEMAGLGLERPTSPRNIVAGMLGRKTHGDLTRYFNFFAFQVVDADKVLGVPTEDAVMRWLEGHGFPTPHPELIQDAAALPAYLERVKRHAEEDEVGLDGAVFAVNDIAAQRDLGVTAHHPRGKLSFKWAGETAITTIRTVSWATSRLGIVTPVAVVDAVFLSGASITNVTLHNAAHVKAYNLKAGDRIEIIRSGEVIPKFLAVAEAAPGDFAWPAACPACATALAFDGVRLKCPNQKDCPAQQIGAILNWIGCAEIFDLSEKRLSHLIDAKLVQTAADLYALKEADFLVIPQTKAKMAAKLFANVQKSRHLPLARFLSGLGIEGIGSTSWEKLLETFPGLDLLRAAKVEEIAESFGFAEKSAVQVVEGLKARSELMEALLAAGVLPSFTPAPVDTGTKPLSGKTLVITGALSRPRAEIEKAIKAAGGKTASSVSASTFAVVTDDPTSTSSKMKKARELGVATWSEEELFGVLGR